MPKILLYITAKVIRIMTILPLTYTRDAATCLTFLGRTTEAVGGIGRTKITPPARPRTPDFKGILT